jgi:Tol biopolymer transport system component
MRSYGLGKSFWSVGTVIMAVLLWGCSDKSTNPGIVYPLRVDEGPIWSSSNLIAYLSGRGGPRGSGGLWLIDPVTKEKEMLLVGCWVSPDWSPDGKWLAFARCWSGGIYKIKADSDSLTKLTSDWSFHPAWSPDGKKIAYSVAGGDLAGIWVIDPDGNNKRRIGQWGWRAPDWSPSGEKFTFEGYIEGKGGICMADSNGANLKLLYPCEISTGTSPSFSPDGTQIVFELNNQVCVMDTAGKRVTSLTRGMEPAWSPDGSKIVFCRTFLWIYDLADKKEYQLTSW